MFDDEPSLRVGLISCGLPGVTHILGLAPQNLVMQQCGVCVALEYSVLASSLAHRGWLGAVAQTVYMHTKSLITNELKKFSAHFLNTKNIYW